MTIRPEDVIANAIFGGNRYQAATKAARTNAVPEIPAEMCAELADVVVEALTRAGYRLVTERAPSRIPVAAL
jgi:hypothetical protein